MGQVGGGYTQGMPGFGGEGRLDTVGSYGSLQDSLERFHRLGLVGQGHAGDVLLPPALAAAAVGDPHTGLGAGGPASPHVGSSRGRAGGSLAAEGRESGAGAGERARGGGGGGGGSGSSRRGDGGGDRGFGDGKRQFVLDLERILRGDDSRTTLMLKNIPNK